MPGPKGNQHAKGHGRPTKYCHACDRVAEGMSLLGGSDVDLARVLEVDESTVNLWKTKHPTFLRAIRAGREEADIHVAKSLYHRARGYSHNAVKIFCNADGDETIIPYVEHYPPDTAAACFILKNRHPERWRDRQAFEHSGPNGGPIRTQDTSLSDEELRTLARDFITEAPRIEVAALNGNGNGANGNGHH